MNQPASSDPRQVQDDLDEREYAEFAQGQDPLDIEAATWVARQRNGLDAAAEDELRAWLAQSPSHQAAYEDLDGTFGRLRDMPAAERRSLKALAAPPTQPCTPRPVSPGRRAWMLDISRFLPQAAAASVAFTVAGSGWWGWDYWRRQPTFEKNYATARGQQLQAELPDGSHLLLDTSTQAEVRLFRDRREVRLPEGQAFFTVQADPSRPFHVLAGALRITVVGTRFSVRHTRSGMGEGETQVVVEQGRVRVARVQGEGSVELTAGQAVAADSSGQLRPVASVPPGSAAPWRDGRVSFDNIPLAQALAEFERYGSTGVLVRDPAVAALRVGGSYSLKNFRSFVQALPQQLPVRLAQRGNVTEVVGIR
ncbi:FecR domain-containing protein [Xylophilus sp. GW821-FHT01B05]